MWNGGTKVPLEFTSEDVARFAATYLEAFSIITGYTLELYQRTNMYNT